jgi:hypothetical protein
MGGPSKNDFMFQAEPLRRLISESLNEGLVRALALIGIIAYEKCSKASEVRKPPAPTVEEYMASVVCKSVDGSAYLRDLLYPTCPFCKRQYVIIQKELILLFIVYRVAPAITSITGMKIFNR